MRDNFFYYIVAWKQCSAIQAADITEMLDLAHDASGLDHLAVVHRPRLFSNNSSPYVSEGPDEMAF